MLTQIPNTVLTMQQIVNMKILKNIVAKPAKEAVVAVVECQLAVVQELQLPVVQEPQLPVVSLPESLTMCSLF